MVEGDLEPTPMSWEGTLSLSCNYDQDCDAGCFLHVRDHMCVFKPFVIHPFNNARDGSYEEAKAQSGHCCYHLRSGKQTYCRHIPPRGSVEPMILRKEATYSHT